MTTRRDFLVAFTGCALLDALPARGQPRRREVSIGRKRIRTIDVHAHCAFPEAMALMGRKVTPASLAMAEDRIRAMDEQASAWRPFAYTPSCPGPGATPPPRLTGFQKSRSPRLWPH